MKRFYYFGCRGTATGHYIHASPAADRHSDHLDNGFPIHMLDGTFAPLDRGARHWRLTRLRYGNSGHIMSILACHDNTIDKRPGSNAAFVVVDEHAWGETGILESAHTRFPDCWERLKDVERSDP